jgi:hypothetical protein
MSEPIRTDDDGYIYPTILQVYPLSYFQHEALQALVNRMVDDGNSCGQVYLRHLANPIVIRMPHHVDNPYELPARPRYELTDLQHDAMEYLIDTMLSAVQCVGQINISNVADPVTVEVVPMERVDQHDINKYTYNQK